MKKSHPLFFILSLGFLFITLAEAKVYKWTDEAGVIHYSSTPPKPTENISDLNDNLRITDNKAAAYHAPHPAKKAGKHPLNESKRNARKAVRTKRNYCNGQRRNYALLKKNLKVRWIKDGKSKKLNAKQRLQTLHSLEQNINSHCSNNNETNNEPHH